LLLPRVPVILQVTPQNLQKTSAIWTTGACWLIDKSCFTPSSNDEVEKAWSNI